MKSQTSAPSRLPPREMRVYLTVPFDKKEEVKRLGAQWDPILSRWWIPRHNIATSPAIHH